MKNFLIRITIIITSLYFTLAFLLAEFSGVDILSDFYVLFFELCVCVTCQKELHYHCTYIKKLCWTILVIDTISRIDNVFDIFSISTHNLIPLFFLLGVNVLYILQSFIHYVKVLKIKKKRYGKYNKTKSDKHSTQGD